MRGEEAARNSRGAAGARKCGAKIARKRDCEVQPWGCGGPDARSENCAEKRPRGTAVGQKTRERKAKKRGAAEGVRNPGKITR